MASRWDCHSARNPGQKGRKRRKIERMEERIARACGKKEPPSKMEAKYRQSVREREIEFIKIEQAREREYFDLRKPPLPEVLAVIALLTSESV